MSKPGIAAIWCRVSTSDQRELSLDAQEKAVRQALAQAGFETPSKYLLKVDWTSLDLMACPQFQLLHKWITTGEVAALGVLDRDRLQAQGLQRLVFLAECREQGVQVITAQGVPMLDGGEGQLVEMALALGKERSVLRAQQGARDGIRTRATQKGLPPNYRSPYGMRWDHDRLVPNEDYPVACEIWQMGLEGKTLWSIAKALTQRGLPTPKGRRVWSSTTIGGILSNRAYAGVVEALKTQAVAPKKRRSGTYGNSSTRSRPKEDRVRLEGLVTQPVVSEEEFEWVQEKRRYNQRFATKNTRLRDYLLKGRIRCALCGRVYTGVTRNGRSFYYCRGRAKQHWGAERCPAKSFSAKVLETAVYDTVANVLQDPEVYLTEIGLQQHITEQTIRSLKDELAGLEVKFREEQSAESQVLRLASRFRISEDVFLEEVGLIQTRQTWIENEKERLTGLLYGVQDVGPAPEALAILRDRLGENLSRCDFQDQKFVLDAVGAKVIASGDGSWELELELPQEPPSVLDEQIENAGPRLGWGQIAEDQSLI